MRLISVLTEQSAKRYQAGLEHEAKMEELAMRRHEIDVQNAELLAKADSERRETSAKLRQQKRENSANFQRGKRANQKLLDACKVCANDGDPSLTAYDIQWHHSGHPAGQMPLTAQ